MLTLTWRFRILPALHIKQWCGDREKARLLEFVPRPAQPSFAVPWSCINSNTNSLDCSCIFAIHACTGNLVLGFEANLHSLDNTCCKNILSFKNCVVMLKLTGVNGWVHKMYWALLFLVFWVSSPQDRYIDWQNILLNLLFQPRKSSSCTLVWVLPAFD